MNIAELKAGTELNRLIAEKVMGLVKSVNREDYYGNREQGRSDDVFGYFQPLMNYSGYIGAAWEVFQFMRQQIFSKRVRFMEELKFIVSQRTIRFTVAWPDVFWFVTPEIICLAALAAMERE